MADTRRATLWTCDWSADRLICDSIEEALEEHRDYIYPDPLPETIKVYGFAPMQLPAPDFAAEAALELTLENLDEEYGDPDGDYQRPTEAMREAALTFVKAVFAEYRVWACERVDELEVRTTDYAPKEWLQPESEEHDEHD